MEFEIVNSVVCDDVRREVSGKDILVGVYTGGIAVSALPALFHLCFWFEILPKAAGILFIEVKIEVGRKTFGVMRVRGNVRRAREHFSVSTPQLSMPIVKADDVRVSARAVGADKWKMVYRIAISLAPEPDPTDPAAAQDA